MSRVFRRGEGFGPSIEWQTLPIVGGPRRKPARVSRLRWMALGFVLAILLMKIVG